MRLHITQAKIPLPNPHLTLRCASGTAGTQGTGIMQTLPNAVFRVNIAVSVACRDLNASIPRFPGDQETIRPRFVVTRPEAKYYQHKNTRKTADLTL